MRLAALAATALGLAICVGVADAKTITDPHGRFIVDTPASWTMTDRTLPANEFSYVILGTANNECQILVFPSDNLATATPRQVQRVSANDPQFSAAFWTTSANGVVTIFPDNSAAVISTSAEHDLPWPEQHAEITSPQNTEIAAPKTVHATLQLRPGFEIYSYCMTYSGADAVAAYTAVAHSIRTSNDATWEAAAQAEQAQHDAQAAAAAATAAQHPAQHPAPAHH